MEAYKKYFHKHKELVQAIFMNVHKNQSFLSNVDIQQNIIPMIKNIKYKSPSLIRKVFAKMQTFDFTDFDANEIKQENKLSKNQYYETV